MTGKNEWAGQVERSAHCLTCGKKWYESNAHGVGVKHARKHRHNVIVEITRSYCYFHEEEESGE